MLLLTRQSVHPPRHAGSLEVSVYACMHHATCIGNSWKCLLCKLTVEGKQWCCMDWYGVVQELPDADPCIKGCKPLPSTAGLPLLRLNAGYLSFYALSLNAGFASTCATAPLELNVCWSSNLAIQGTVCTTLSAHRPQNMHGLVRAFQSSESFLLLNGIHHWL